MTDELKAKNSRDFQDRYGNLDRMAEVIPAEHIDDHYRAFWALAIGLSTLVAERAFRRVETDEERLEVAERVVALQVDTVLARYGG